MGHLVTDGVERTVDLETGENVSDGRGGGGGDGNKSLVPSVVQAKKLMGMVWIGSQVSFDGSINGEDGYISSTHLANSAELAIGNAEALTEKKSAGGEEKMGTLENKGKNEKRKKASPKKPPKPPRPPRGPSLDASDLKLIKEISELAMLKRARIKRAKAMKSQKTAKAALSSNSNLWALVITILFFLVILFQGLSSRVTSLVNFEGSPESTVALSGGLVSVKYFNNLSASGTVGLGS